MIRVRPEQITNLIVSLLDSDMPGGLRCYGVLDGITQGDVYTDDLEHPAWVLVRESGFGTLFPGGAVDAPLLAGWVEHFGAQGETMIGLWQDDPRLALMPSPEYTGTVIDFTDRPVGAGLDELLALPAGCEIRRVDAALLPRLNDFELIMSNLGTVENALAKIVGFCLMRGDEILCEASGGAPIRGIIEIGVETREAHRRNGYAAVTCAHLIKACEAMGCQTYWNANASNVPSVRLAHRLSYRTAREYTLVWWSERES